MFDECNYEDDPFWNALEAWFDEQQEQKGEKASDEQSVNNEEVAPNTNKQ